MLNKVSKEVLEKEFIRVEFFCNFVYYFSEKECGSSFVIFKVKIFIFFLVVLFFSILFLVGGGLLFSRIFGISGLLVGLIIFVLIIMIVKINFFFIMINSIFIVFSIFI